jgi:hypothetical protein
MPPLKDFPVISNRIYLAFAIKLMALRRLIPWLQRPDDLDYVLRNKCFDSLINPYRASFQREACILLLDWVHPGWRKDAPVDVLGAIIERGDPEVREWRIAVLERDQYQCRQCGSREKLHAHHLIPWSICTTLRTVVQNGLTVCELCHYQLHGKQHAGT